jgi:hypothetical protein
VLPLAGGMLNGENDDFLPCLIVCIIDEVRISSGDEFTHALHRLCSADLRKQDQILQRTKNGGAHMLCGVRIARIEVVGNRDKVLCRARRKSKLHRSKRRNAAATSSSVANWRRFAWARPSRTAGRCAGSIASGSPSSPAKVSMARAISSWLLGGNRRTASSAVSRSFVIGQQYAVCRQKWKGLFQVL